MKNNTIKDYNTRTEPSHYLKSDKVLKMETLKCKL